MKDYYDLTFFSGPSHGWLKVPYALLAELGIQDEISSYSYIDGGRDVYLESDSDVPKFFAEMRKCDDCVVRTYTKVIERESPIRSLQAYHPVPVEEFSVLLTLDIETTGAHVSDLWDQYERDPVAWITGLVNGDWTVESLDIRDVGSAQ